MLSINKQSPLPIYYQLKELLREKIATGEWTSGMLIPSERELSEQFEISRMTVRQALSELTSEGLLRRKQGVGTFVAEPKIQQTLARLTGFTEDMRTRGLNPRTRVLRLELVSPPLPAQQALQIDSEQPVVLLERLRMTGDDPIALETCYLHFDGVQGLLNEDFEQNSLYDTLSTKYNVTPTKARQQIEADLCTPREQELLAIAENKPVLRNRRVTFDQWGRCFEYTESAYRADRYTFKVELDTSKEVRP